MSERICDKCGRSKDIKNGVTCEKGHFICASCKRVEGLLTISTRTKCPICDKPLR